MKFFWIVVNCFIFWFFLVCYGEFGLGIVVCVIVLSFERFKSRVGVYLFF